MVRGVKRCLINSVDRALLDFIELNTLLIEIEGIINSRPLTYLFDDSEGVSYPLTPSQLVNGRHLSLLPHDNFYEIIGTYESLSRRAKYNRLLLSQFARRWKNEYVLGLVEAFKPKEHTKEPRILVGDIVILKDDQSKHVVWKLGKIQELITGRYGSVRAAKIQVANVDGKFEKVTKGFVKRPLKLLSPLEVHSVCADGTKAASSSISSDSEVDKVVNRTSNRPKRNAAIITDIVRKDSL